MADKTPLDTAHANMAAAGENDSARLRFYERLADCELFVLLREQAGADRIDPEIFTVDEQSYILVFDRESRLTRFVGCAAPYAAMSGRAIAALLAPERIGLGVNLEVAESSILIPPEAVVWLNETLGNTPSAVEAQIESFSAPAGLPETLIAALDTKLATGAGLARNAYLVGVTYEGGGRGHMLGFVGSRDGAQHALAQATNEVLAFSGIEAGTIDVGFFAESDPVCAHLARFGLRFQLPEPATPADTPRPAPGSDPSRPPILR